MDDKYWRDRTAYIEAQVSRDRSLHLTYKHDHEWQMRIRAAERFGEIHGDKVDRLSK